MFERVIGAATPGAFLFIIPPVIDQCFSVFYIAVSIGVEGYPKLVERWTFLCWLLCPILQKDVCAMESGGVFVDSPQENLDRTS